MNKTEENLRRIREYNRHHVGDSAFAVQDDWDESKHPRAANLKTRRTNHHEH